MIQFRLPKQRSMNGNDPRWMRELKDWCNDVVYALKVLRRLQGDRRHIIIDNNVIKFLGGFSGTAYIAGKKVENLNQDPSKEWVRIDADNQTAEEVFAAQVPTTFPPNMEFYEKRRTFGDIHVTRL